MTTREINMDAERDAYNHARAMAEIVLDLSDVTGTARDLAETLAFGRYRNAMPNNPVQLAYELRNYEGPHTNAVHDMATAVLKWDRILYPGH